MAVRRSSTRQNGAPSLPAPDGDGPLRLVVAQADRTSTRSPTATCFVKWVDHVTLRGAVAEWKVKMYGLKRKNGTRQTYTLDRDVATTRAPRPAVTASTWTKPTTQKTWSGVPLFLCIGKVDGGKGHDSYGAYNEALALEGLPHQADVGDGQVRDPRLAHHPQPRRTSCSPTS